MKTPPILYQIVGAFDAYGDCRWKKIYKAEDGSLCQNYPGHADGFIGAAHKRWRWWVAEKRLDGPELMHWTPDVEEMDRIQRIVSQFGPTPADIPLVGMVGKYPSWPEINNPMAKR